MRKVRRIFVWICRPQALVGFIVLCLCVGALSSFVRANAATLQPHFRPSVPPPVATESHVDCNIKPCLALTFDDGPSAAVTPQILDVLAREQVKATFFVVGLHVAGNEQILQREHREGHEIGNHSWSHPDLTLLSPEDAQAQIQATQTAISNTGVPAPTVLRPPYGAANDMLLAHNNLSIVRWNVDPADWQSLDPVKIDQDLLAHVHPGSIVLLHDIYPTTVAALGPALDVLKQQYQFLTVSQLLDLTPGDQGQYFARYR
jgi:peptidoglycan/xylan/chitin deacetylase (PgdA/CDA1 family)